MTDFNDLSRQQMVEAAERFGVTVDGRWSDKSLAAALLTAGVTMDNINSAEDVLLMAGKDPVLSSNGGPSDELADDKMDDDGAPVAADETETKERAVLKMDRHNKSYKIMGHKFTQEHPYIVMDREEALWISETVDGFRIADPSEAARFYKKG